MGSEAGVAPVVLVGTRQEARLAGEAGYKALLLEDVPDVGRLPLERRGVIVALGAEAAAAFERELGRAGRTTHGIEPVDPGDYLAAVRDDDPQAVRSLLDEAAARIVRRLSPADPDAYASQLLSRMGIRSSFDASIEVSSGSSTREAVEGLTEKTGMPLAYRSVAVVGGTPGVGKTAVALWLAEAAASTGVPVCVVHGLESRRDLMARIVAGRMRDMAKRGGVKMQGEQAQDLFEAVCAECAGPSLSGLYFLDARFVDGPDGLSTSLREMGRILGRRPVAIVDDCDIVWGGRVRGDALLRVARDTGASLVALMRCEGLDGSPGLPLRGDLEYALRPPGVSLPGCLQLMRGPSDAPRRVDIGMGCGVAYRTNAAAPLRRQPTRGVAAR